MNTELSHLEHQMVRISIMMAETSNHIKRQRLELEYNELLFQAVVNTQERWYNHAILKQKRA